MGVPLDRRSRRRLGSSSPLRHHMFKRCLHSSEERPLPMRKCPGRTGLGDPRTRFREAQAAQNIGPAAHGRRRLRDEALRQLPQHLGRALGQAQ
eukprot:8923731-Pyramimonas_sp.AAC.1